jgi:hypothetical protein
MTGAHNPSHPGRFRPFLNPATREHIQHTVVAEDSAGPETLIL